MTVTCRRFVMLAAAVAALVLGQAAVLADGMIVPIRPDIRVRGSWAVKYHHVDIKVREQVASVSIDQQFINTGRGMIEVEYLFPVPPGAAIDSMTLIVDGKEFAARLLKADEARKIYENIVRQKKDPALLEYAGFGLYKTRAFPLLPGKPCKVIVTYKNVCRKDRDLVEVWYPLNTEKFSARPIESVRVKVDLKAKADIGPVYSPSHDLKVERKDPRHVIATYEAKGTLPTTDFQVFYKAEDKKIGATLLTYQGDSAKDGHFMMLVSPNPRSSGKAVVAKDVVLVFDHSGSMSGKKIDQAKEALVYTLRNLNREDRFNVVSYNDTIDTFFPHMVEATKAKVTDAVDMVDRIEATGGTNIHEALQKALELLPGKGKGRPKYIIFMTDGAPTVGKTDSRSILGDTKKANTARARIFAFGVGYKPNVQLLDKLVEQNNGRSGYVKPKEAIEAKVAALYNKIKNPVMTNLSISLQGVNLRDMYPRDVGDLFDGDQIVLLGRYAARDVAKLPSREKGVHHTTLVVKGVYQGKQRAFEYNVSVRKVGKDMRFVFVEKIWAVRRVGYLLDQIQLHGKNQEVIDELIRLSKKYGIMTPYTSFLAEENTKLHRPNEVRERGIRLTKGLADEAAGESAHRGSDTRLKLRDAKKAPGRSAPPSPPATGPVAPGGRPRPAKPQTGVAVYGSKDKESYEGGKTDYVMTVRNVGGYTLYRRGRRWATAKASEIDAKKNAAKIKTIQRFSDAYFALIKLNTVAENQVLASQQDHEELLIVLRGQTYLIK